jgi:XapX domain-containing protein
MKIYLVSLAAGLFVGVIYSLLQVRSPAPPLIALVGLFGILLGEQAIPVARKVFSGSSFHVAWRNSDSQRHVFGLLPGRHQHEEIPAPSPPQPNRTDANS